MESTMQKRAEYSIKRAKKSSKETLLISITKFQYKMYYRVNPQKSV